MTKLIQKRIVFFGVILAAMFLAMLLGIHPVEAMKPEKVLLCHWDKNKSTFKTKWVNENRVPSHLSHGDYVPLNGETCELQEEVIAVAFIDEDEDDMYSPNSDGLIAKITDANSDGILSIGDLVITDKFLDVSQCRGENSVPLPPSCLSIVDFTNTRHEITEIVHVDEFFIQVRSGTGFFHFQKQVNPTSFAEQYSETDNINNQISQITDNDFLGEVGNDIGVWQNPLSPSAPPPPSSNPPGDTYGYWGPSYDNHIFDVVINSDMLP